MRNITLTVKGFQRTEYTLHFAVEIRGVLKIATLHSDSVSSLELKKFIEEKKSEGRKVFVTSQSKIVLEALKRCGIEEKAPR